MNASSAAPVTSGRRSLFVEQMADETVLREAWYRVQRGGRTGGVDRVTVEAFRPHADQRLQQLRESLVRETYQPSPVKRVQIPKTVASPIGPSSVPAGPRSSCARV